MDKGRWRRERTDRREEIQTYWEDVRVSIGKMVEKSTKRSENDRGRVGLSYQDFVCLWLWPSVGT